MEIVVPIVLVLLGLGALHLALGGLIRLGKERPEFWLFGLGVRSRFGALKVLAVALALLFLAYSFWQQGSLIRGLQPELAGAQEEAKARLARLEVATRSLQDLQYRSSSRLSKNRNISGSPADARPSWRHRPSRWKRHFNGNSRRLPDSRKAWLNWTACWRPFNGKRRRLSRTPSS